MTAITRIEDLLKRKNLTISFTEQPSEVHSLEVVEPSPCTQACPAGVNVKAYVSLIAAGRFLEALEVVRQSNPLPGICGRVCTHPCEAACNRQEIDSPVAVCWLKRFVADYELAHSPAKPKPIPRTRKEKIAVIGSGPAGLTAANDLVRMGFGITVFESLPVPGGMLVAGIPAYRLPREIIRTEIEVIQNLGVEIKTNTPVSGDKAIDDLFKAGYAAVFLAIGAHKGRKLGVPGEDKFEGIVDCINFLNEVNLGQARKLGDRVIVIGGGSSAVDSARTALRLGSKEVYIVYRRSRKEMPAHEAEIDAAEQEGVKLHYLAAPVKVLGENGRVTGMECQKMKLGKPDSSGRRRPVPIEGSEFVIKADAIVTAISQSPDLTCLPGDQGVEITSWNTLATYEGTLATARPGVFAGGDAVTGPSTVVDAIAAGHVAARSIARYLNGEPLTQAKFLNRPLEYEIKADQQQRERSQRAVMPALDVSNRITNFNEVDLGFDEIQAVAEAQRCLRCGPCSECFACVPDCDKTTTVLTSPDASGESLFRVPMELGRQILSDGIGKTVIQSGTKKQLPFQVIPVIPHVQQELCRGCGDCIEVCDYEAISLIRGNGENPIAEINPDICRGCGTCVAVCPTGAMMPGYYSDDWLTQRLGALEPDKKNIVVFACHWNGSNLDDESLQSIIDKTTHLEIIHTMCSGRINPGIVLQALESGAEGVLITGCGPHECHYGIGAKQANRSFRTIEQLIHLIGIKPQRVRFTQLPRADSNAFVATVREFVREMNVKGNGGDEECGR